MLREKRQFLKSNYARKFELFSKKLEHFSKKLQK